MAEAAQTNSLFLPQATQTNLLFAAGHAGQSTFCRSPCRPSYILPQATQTKRSRVPLLYKAFLFNRNLVYLNVSHFNRKLVYLNVYYKALHFNKIGSQELECGLHHPK